MKMATEVCKDESKLMSFSRVRGFLEAIYLSDITTIDGKYLEEWAVKKGNYEKRSNYDFPKEQPSNKDWNEWIDVMKSMTTCNYGLMTPLGE